ncbi:MAG: DUF427 domain-containing protein [Bernardetiaceae bacterium]
MKAIWNDQVIAQSNETVVVEGNHYFPPEAIQKEFFKPSIHSTYCPWKGKASYYSLEVAGKTNDNAAWYYADPKPEAKQIKGYIAFWKGVQVME